MAIFDARIIERAAERLYDKAAAVVLGSLATGALLGAAFGAVPLTSLGAAWPVPSSFGIATLLVGAIVGAAIGYVVGDARAFGYRLQAQASLCQLQIERNTAALVGLLREAPTEVTQPVVVAAIAPGALATLAPDPRPEPRPQPVLPPPVQLPPRPAPIPVPDLPAAVELSRPPLSPPLSV